MTSSSSPSSVILRNPERVSDFGFLLEVKVELVLVDLEPDKVVHGGGVIAFQTVLQLLPLWLARPCFTHLPSLLLLSFLSSATFSLARPALLLECALLLERVLLLEQVLLLERVLLSAWFGEVYKIEI